MKNLTQLNDEFGCNEVTFYEGAGGFTFVDLISENSTATISLYGAHLTAFQPTGEEPVIWLSEKAIFQKGGSIRGGIPICWPWFSGHPTNPSLPNHGFTRFHDWQVEGVSTGDFGTKVTLFLTENAKTLEIWNHTFKVKLTVTINQSLKMELSFTNETQETITVGSAFHPYFKIGDIAKTTVKGLAGTTYIDFADAQQKIIEPNAVEAVGPVDRIYLDTTADCTIVDLENNRQINIAKTGSKTTVIWNPWIEGATDMKDMADDGYKTMLCVEPANMLDDVYTLATGDTHTLTTEISSKPLK